MDTVGKGIIAGFLATLALSLFLDPFVVLSRTVWASGSTIGWQLHFFVGPVMWGAGLALFHDHMAGPSWLRGVVFAFGAWLVVMVVAMPLAGAGLFGQSAATLATTLVVHVGCGALMGAVYGWLISRDRPSAASDERLRPLAR